MIDPNVANAIIYGSLVSMMCVGLTLTYLTTKVPNFAHADFVVTGIYASSLAFILGGVGSPYYGLPLAFLVGSASAVLVYLLVLKPMSKRGSSVVSLMVATLAVDIIFTGLVGIFIDYVSRVDGRVLQNKGYTLYTLYQLSTDENTLLVVAPAVLILSVAGIFLLLTRTRFGVAMRAAIENPNLARTLGIDVDRVSLFSWLLAGGFAGLAGGLYAVGFATPQNFPTLLIVDIFAGSVLGGLSSIYGALIGGFIIGASETFLTTALSTVVGDVYGPGVGSQIVQFERGIPLAMMIVILLVAPQGIVAIRWRRLGRRAV